MNAFASFLAAVLLTAIRVNGRMFTVYNNCSFAIWPAVFTDLNVGTAVPAVATGWAAQPQLAMTFYVPDNWTSGRIWGRQGCNFTGVNDGPTSCLTGGCNGGLLCDPHTGTGVPPATLAEFTLNSNGQDFYDVSLVDGFNLPLNITSDKGCPIAGCSADLNANCPANLKGPTNSAGGVVGCKSDCLVDPNPTDSPSCCSGTHNTAATCPPSGVPDYSYFKTGCPDSYVYAYDESSGTALWTCSSADLPNYTITFCP